MSKTLIRNIGCLLSGDIHEPILSADSVLIEDGVIQEIDTGLTAEDAVVYDAKGSALMPCLIDSHVHVSIAEWAPRQSTMQYLDAYAASGITGIISAGETHVPHRPSDPEGVKALAELSHRIYSSYRPGGAEGVRRCDHPRHRSDRGGFQASARYRRHPRGRVRSRQCR